ncbi:MAG: hypothetical protein DHS20C04_25720 [Hyphococcus sp.]|nr:MAG: hypothetical protein DHS20C04_25720 [Marinicaulis sp.]
MVSVLIVDRSILAPIPGAGNAINMNPWQSGTGELKNSRQVQLFVASTSNSLFVARIRMAHNAGGWIIPQDAF